MTTDSERADNGDDYISAFGSTSGGAIGGAVGAIISGPIGGAVGGAIGGLIPLLVNIPAAKRQRKRTEQALVEIDQKLNSRIEDLNKLSDEQFKVISESLLTLRETVEEEKLDYLKKIVIASVDYSDYSSYQSLLLSRIIRDISAEEIVFLIENFGFTTINIYSWYDPKNVSDKKLEEISGLREKIKKEGGLLLLPGSPKSIIANGLLNLGILLPSQLALGVYKYRYSEIAVKLITLLRKD